MRLSWPFLLPPNLLSEPARPAAPRPPETLLEAKAEGDMVISETRSTF